MVQTDFILLPTNIPGVLALNPEAAATEESKHRR
jgi:hypothetical protein